MPDKVYVITGPTSGFGRRAALALAEHGTVVLVGRNAAKLDDVRSTIEGTGGKAVSVLCDLSDLTSVRRAVARITELGLPIAGVLNNAGIFPTSTGTAQRHRADSTPGRPAPARSL
ncbi:SDR family NAD(P)-dependent oxidoreductase [Streptomyces sp. MH13]|uniref:SDR family NAD(P)-dependent oxidoreductase n=1 Tax=Streptomyces sp. MH13 TaxID=3417651 RepID=UPI003CEFDF22